MTKKNWFMLIVLAVLALVYAFYFTGWFRPKVIHVSSTSRAGFSRFGGNPAFPPAAVPVTFSLDREYRLTEIRVVPLAAWQTNPSVVPVWHLVYAGSPAVTKMFVYGQDIGGLKPELPGTHAEPLRPDVTYRLFVTAGSAKGEHDFEIKPAN